MKTILAIPAFNCAKQIDRVLNAIGPDLAERFSDILVIDNRSTDNTVKVALKHKPTMSNLHVLRNTNNYSLGGSHKVAFLYAEKVGAQYVAILHGDDQAVASELNGLLDEAEKHPEADAILGARFMRESRLQGYDWKRIAGNRVLNIIYTALTGYHCLDLGSGLNVFKLSIFKDHTYLAFADRLTFNYELLLYMIGKGARIIFYPITWREEDQVSNARNFNIAKVALINVVKWRFGRLRYGSIPSPLDYDSVEMS